MDAKHYIYLAMVVLLIPAISALLVMSKKARDWALFLMIFCTAFAYSAQVTFDDRIWYRGTSTGFDVSIIDLLAFGLIVACILRPRPGQGKIYWPAGLLPLLLYVAYCCMSVLFSTPKLFGMWEVFREFRGVLVVIAVAWYVRTEREMKILVLGLACAVCYLGFTALKTRYMDGTYRVDAHLVHPNSLSMYLCMAAPVLCAATMTKLPKWTHRLCILGIALSLVGVILTISRTGFVAWGVVMLGVTLACMSYRITFKKIAMTFLVLACVGGMVAYSWKTFDERLKYTNFDEENDPDKLGRGSYIRLAKLISSERFWGVGLNNWSWYVTNEYQAKDNPKPELQYKPYTSTDDWPDRVPVKGNETAQAAPSHNLSALTVAELGWVGAFLFLCVWLRWLDMGQRFLWKRSPDIMRRLAVGILFGMTAVFLESLTEWAYRQNAIYYEFHILIGALAAMYQVRKKKKFVPVAAPVMQMAQPAQMAQV